MVAKATITPSAERSAAVAQFNCAVLARDSSAVVEADSSRINPAEYDRRCRDVREVYRFAPNDAATALEALDYVLSVEPTSPGYVVKWTDDPRELRLWTESGGGKAPGELAAVDSLAMPGMAQEFARRRAVSYQQFLETGGLVALGVDYFVHVGADRRAETDEAIRNLLANPHECGPSVGLLVYGGFRRDLLLALVREEVPPN